MRILRWIVLGSFFGCTKPEPILSGIPETAILEPDEENVESKSSTHAKAYRYTKSPAVYVDIRHIAGQRLTDVRDIVADQLGTLQNRRTLSTTNGEELQFIHGTIRVVNGRIYMVRVPLLRPMRRTEALEEAGFPPYASGVIRSHREFRINHEWDFRRIRLKRAGPDDELVVELEAWRWLPRDRDNGR